MRLRRPWWFDALVAGCLITALVLLTGLICELATGSDCRWPWREIGDHVDTLQGEVTSWRYEPKADTGWHIVYVTDADGREHTVTGCSLPRPGAHVELQGTWEDSPKYGPQFKCRVVAKSRPPLGGAGVARWLRERVPGIGKRRAEAMLAHFGGDAAKLWAALEAGASELGGVVSPDIARAAHEAMLEEGEAGEYQALLFGWGMTQRQIAKVKKHWPLELAIKLLHANPYLLADHVPGFGFHRADQVAVRIGLPPTSQVRMHAAVLHYLAMAAGEGHVFADNPVMMWIARETRISYGRLLEAVKELKAAERLIVEDGARIYLPLLHAAEVLIAKDLAQRFRVFSGLRSADAFTVGDAEVIDVGGPRDAAPAADHQQMLAVLRFADLSLPVAFLTGGPGTGKTTVLKQALAALEAQGVTVYLGAPTGKAAKRMQETTGRRASTLHSMLGYRPETDIDCDVCRAEEASFDFSRIGSEAVVVVDEASMVDVRLWAALAALGPDTRLRFVGDAHQLPPVGAGQPFSDALSVAPGEAVVRLRTVYRTKGEWGKAAAPMILAGKVPPLEAAPGFRWLAVDNPDHIKGVIKAVYSGAHDDAHFHIAAATAETHMPTLIPQRTGSAGVNEVNRALHDMFNAPEPDAPTVRLEDGNELRVGSWVMIVKNDARKRVCNGDTAYITQISATGSVCLNVDSDDGGERLYTRGEAREQLRLAYASTVHKCVAPDTLVETPSGLMSIAELGAEGVIATAEGLRVYDTHVVNPAGPMLRIETVDGYEITVTPEHGLMAWNGEAYERIEAHELADGHVLRLRLGATCEPAPPKLPPTPTDLHPITVVHRTPAELTLEAAEFLGLMVADGTVYPAGFRLVKRHRDVAERFAALCEELFGARVSRHAYDTHHAAEVSSVQLVKWLRSIGGLAPKQKAIPVCILRAPLAMQCAFLRGLFEDGTVNIRGEALDHIEWSSCSETMVRTVQVMLLRAGIIASRTRRDGQHLIYIYGENAKRFGEAIGFVSSFKHERLKLRAGKETRYTLPVARGRCRISEDPNANNRGYISRESARAIGGFEAELGYHHSRIASVTRTAGTSMCVRVPSIGRFLQNGFDGSNSQGSEYPWIVVVAHSLHKRMLTRRLLYTAITRAKDGVVLIGDRDGVEWAVGNAREVTRCSWLPKRLGGEHYAQR
jgi:exodeoxyribonuclease V alpha subunit